VTPARGLFRASQNPIMCLCGTRHFELPGQHIRWFEYMGICEQNQNNSFLIWRELKVTFLKQNFA
jgi:hypothetical protein